MPKALKVIQFTDTHLYKDSTFRMKGVDTYSTFKQAVTQAFEKEHDVDFVLLTGDVSMDETPESYDRVREIVEPIGVPIYFLPGNHDCYETMQIRFVHHRQKSNIKGDKSFIQGNWLIVLLNSVVPMRVEGRLSENELTRLERALTAHPDLNVLVCLHHNVIPFTAGEPESDMGLKNAGAFLRLLDKHKNVKGILWGHVHSEHNLTRNGIPLMASPSTCIQFRALPEGVKVDARPPGYRVLVLNADGSIRSRVEWLANMPEGLLIGTPDD